MKPAAPVMTARGLDMGRAYESMPRRRAAGAAAIPRRGGRASRALPGRAPRRRRGGPAAPIERRLRRGPLVRMLVEEPFDEREPHDLEVEPHRPVLDVIQIVFDPLLERRVAPPSVDLRPSGQTRLHLVAQHVLRNPMLELLDKVRALGPRPHDRHVAAEDVPELRQLVEIRSPEKTAERRDPWVVLLRP